MAQPIHLHPTAPLAERVLLPGDPGRALLLAQSLLEGPAMFNHHRGLWGYTGTAPDGKQMTIQSTGIGGPSAAIVISELADLGARRLVRVGTCGALTAELALGDLVVASAAIGDDGTSVAVAGDAPLAPTSELLATLVATAGSRAHVGAVVSTDLFYADPSEGWSASGAIAVEMETATLFALAAARGLEAASLLLVTDVLLDGRTRIDPDGLRTGEHRLGEVAVAALAG